MYFILLAAIIGLFIGSFLNAWIYRLEVGESILRGRSKCPNCGRTLSWFELIPIFSFILQRRRCRGCKKRIAVQYLVAEIATALLFGFIFWKYGGATILAIRDCVFVSAFLVLFIFDLKHGLVPEVVVIPATVIAFFWNFLMEKEWQNLLLATVIGAGFFFLQFALSRGRWIGGGDIRIGGMLGAMVGFPLILPAIFISYILGSILSLALILAKKASFKTAIPLGTFLTVGGAITLWWGEEIISWYLKFMGL